jgi:hypothetical protein
MNQLQAPRPCRRWAKWFRHARPTPHWWKPHGHGDRSVRRPGGVEKSWRLDATPWSENNTEAFAGLHNQGSRIVMVMDEGSAIADKVWEVAEGVLTDEDTEIIWLVFGNPTRNTGRFPRVLPEVPPAAGRPSAGRQPHGGGHEQGLARASRCKTYGEDSDFVKVRIRGMFPNDVGQAVHLHR